MTDEFLTRGLENDRYLKALRLTDQFEIEIVRVLRRFGDKIVNENPELFETGVAGDENVIRDPGSTLGHARVDYRMNRVQGPNDNLSLKLNIHLYWCRPEQYNRTDIDGALRAFGYKIKNANSDDEERVVAQTHDWDIHTAKNPFGSRIAFYRHVSSSEEIERTGETLVEHFKAFGSEFGVAKGQQSN